MPVLAPQSLRRLVATPPHLPASTGVPIAGNTNLGGGRGGGGDTERGRDGRACLLNGDWLAAAGAQ